MPKTIAPMGLAMYPAKNVRHTISGGYIVGCMRNWNRAYDSVIFKNDVKHNYQYHISFSICPNADHGDINVNKCKPITSIDFSATKDEDNKVEIDLPLYLLDLSAYAGQDSPCSKHAGIEEVVYTKTFGSFNQE